MVVETIRDVAVAFGLAILIPFTLEFGTKVFMPEPKHHGHDPEMSQVYQANQELERTIKTLEDEKKFKEATALKAELKAEQDRYDARWNELQKVYDGERDHYLKMRLLVFGIFGALLLLSSLFIAASFMAGGFMMGGILCFVVGVMHYWHKMDATLQFLVLLGSLILLIVLGYYFAFRERKHQ